MSKNALVSIMDGLFKHFDEVKSIGTTTNNSPVKKTTEIHGYLIPERRIKNKEIINVRSGNASFVTREAYEGDSVPEKIRRIGGPAKIDKVLFDRKEVQETIDDCLLGRNRLGREMSNVNDYPSLCFSTIFDARSSVVDRLMTKRWTPGSKFSGSVVVMKKELPTSVIESIKVQKDPNESFNKIIDFQKLRFDFSHFDVLKDRENVIPSAPFARESLMSNWIRGDRNVDWKSFDSKWAVKRLDIHDPGSKKIVDDFIEQDIIQITDALAEKENFDNWQQIATITRKLSDLNLSGIVPISKEKLITFLQGRVLKDGMKITRSKSNGLTVEFKPLAEKLIDAIINKYPDPDVVETVIAGIYLDNGNNRRMEPTEEKAPYKLNELKRYLFKTKEGENLNDEIHQNILVKWYVDPKIKMRLDCDSTDFLREKEREKMPRDRQNSKFLTLARNNISKMKGNGIC